MSRNKRQLVGGLGVLVFLTVYIGLAVRIADLLPDHWAVNLIYFTVVGVAWGVPLVPLLSWMENGSFRFTRRLR
jgi:hypothetical protein